jgi:hypothetical protein
MWFPDHQQQLHLELVGNENSLAIPQIQLELETQEWGSAMHHSKFSRYF